MIGLGRPDRRARLRQLVVAGHEGERQDGADTTHLDETQPLFWAPLRAFRERFTVRAFQQLFVVTEISCLIGVGQPVIVSDMKQKARAVRFRPAGRHIRGLGRS